MTDDIIDLLSCIDGGDYSFIDESSPIYAELNPGEEEDVDDLELYEANRILEDEGFEVEVINTNAHISGAMLFVHENEVLLLGTRHLDGCSFFVEMKRLFTGVMQEEVLTRIVGYNSNKFKRQTNADRKYYEAYLKKVKRAGRTIAILEYTKSSQMRKEIINYCKKNGYSYYISDNVALK